MKADRKTQELCVFSPSATPLRDAAVFHGSGGQVQAAAPDKICFSLHLGAAVLYQCCGLLDGEIGWETPNALLTHQHGGHGPRWL